MNLYVVGSIVVAVLALAGYGLYERGNAANARADSAEALAAQFRQDLAESEADKAELRAAQKRLDAAVLERDKRLADLQKAKRDLDEEYKKLKGQQSQADQDCLNRPLPDAYVERLRNDRADENKDGAASRAGNAPVPVPTE